MPHRFIVWAVTAALMAPPPLAAGAGFGPSGGGGKTKTATASPVGGAPARAGLAQQEQLIQTAIDKCAFLRETMKLSEEVSASRVSGSANVLHGAAGVSADEFADMEKRLGDLRDAHGWSDESIRHKLHELTWDVFAEQRHERHKEEAPSAAAESHMLAVADLALTNTMPSSGAVLDVGCGTGIMLAFMKKQLEIKRGGKKGVQAALDSLPILGIDLSGEMIRVAQSDWPKQRFVKADFIEYFASNNDPSAGQFGAVIFNECLHHFNSPVEALSCAASILAPGGIIIISHPRGADHVVVQRRANTWLSPSLLPSADQLSKLAEELSLSVQQAPRPKASQYLAVLKKA